MPAACLATPVAACMPASFDHCAGKPAVIDHGAGYSGRLAGAAAVMAFAAGYLVHPARAAAVVIYVPGNWCHLASMRCLTRHQQFAQSELD